MNTTEATNTVKSSNHSDGVSRETQPGLLPDWIARVRKEYMQGPRGLHLVGGRHDQRRLVLLSRGA